MKNINILIAEDSPTQAELLKYILEKHNYEVTVAKDGMKALGFIKEQKPTLVISDIIMPEMNGYKLCIAIKTNPLTSDIPVILLTSLSRAEDVLDGLECGADNFLTKPYAEDYLIATIEHILANREILKLEREKVGIEISVGGIKRMVTATPQQMLTLLLSTYDAASQRNNELTRTQEELRSINDHLEELVIERSAELSAEIDVRKKAEEVLESQHALLSALINSPGDIIIFSLGKNYCYTVFNERHRDEMKRIWNVDIEQGTNLLDCMKIPELRDLAKQCIDRVFAGESFSEIQYQPGQGIYYEFNWNPIFQKDEIAGVTVFVRDITERMYAEEALRLKNLVFDASIAANSIADANGVITEVNNAFLNLWGYAKKDEVVGKHLKHFFNYTDEAKRIMDALDSLGEWEGDFTAVKRYGTTFIAHGFATVIKDKEGEIKGYQSSVLDITRRKKNEQELINVNKELVFQNEEKGKRAAELIIANEELLFQNTLKENRAAELVIFNKELAFQIEEKGKRAAELIIAKENAEESDRLKTAFLQNMSHEIRTPLNGIIGFSTLLNDEDLSRDEIREYTNLINQGGHRLIEIVNNVLDISKIQTGQIKIEKEPIFINSIFSDIATFFAPIARAKNIHLNYQNENDKKTTVFSDEAKLHQILVNLINNAVKFTKTGNIDYGFGIKDDFIQIFVKDTGIGIPQELCDKIFDRFIQVEQSMVKNYEGAGLGLAISKGLVELLGGKIWVESEIGKGSTFFFTIPYSPDEVSNRTYLESADIPLKRTHGKILITEDDWVSFLYLKKILLKSGNTVIHAENGAQAVDFVKNTPDIDLILMDIKMPVMDGIEATRQIKQIRPGLPIIAQTAYANIEEKSKILAMGCDEYLTKPLEQVTLNAFIIKYLK